MASDPNERTPAMAPYWTSRINVASDGYVFRYVRDVQVSDHHGTHTEQVLLGDVAVVGRRIDYSIGRDSTGAPTALCVFGRARTLAGARAAVEAGKLIA